MTSPRDLSRRTLLAVPAVLSLASATAACAQANTDKRSGNSRALVAYFTRSGNTRVIAGTVSRALAADLFEIRPLRPYPEDYERTVAQAQEERDQNIEPPLASLVPKMASYETVFLGFPIWGETAPPIVRSFLRVHDMAGKVLRPFITHGGYGLGNSIAILTSHARGARIEPAFVMEADQERRTLTQVSAWLDERGLG